MRTIPSDPGGGARRVSVDRVRGTLGRASEGVLQRADRAEPQGSVDGADPDVGGLARTEHRGSGRRRVRDRRDGLLLRRGRRRLERAPEELGRSAAARSCYASRVLVVADRRSRSRARPGGRRRRSGSRVAARGARSSRRRRACTSSGLPLVPRDRPRGVADLRDRDAPADSLLLRASSVVGVETEGESGGVFVFLVVALGTALTLFGLGLVMAATARALVEIDQGREIGPLRAYRMSLRRRRPASRCAHDRRRSSSRCS